MAGKKKEPTERENPYLHMPHRFVDEEGRELPKEYVHAYVVSGITELAMRAQRLGQLGPEYDCLGRVEYLPEKGPLGFSLLNRQGG